MRQRIYFLKAFVYGITWMVCTQVCNGDNYDMQLEKKLKSQAVEYGDRLSSLEDLSEAPYFLARVTDTRLGRNQVLMATETVEVRQRPLHGSLSNGVKITTRCTTDSAITLDPQFVPESTEEDNEDDKEELSDPTTVRMKEVEDSQEDLEEEDDPTKNSINVLEEPERPQNYKPPPTAKSPDHYIDDP